MNTTAASERSRVRRIPARASYDREVVDRILDEGLVAHVGVVTDEQPFVIPMVYARQGDQLLLHGAPASRLLKQGSAGTPMCATVTLLDGLVLARSAFHHSLNYRSVVVLGRAHLVVDEATKLAALTAFLEHIAPGRSRESRPPNAKELAGTTVIALPIEEVSAKSRSGDPVEDEEDLALPHWAGQLPLTMVAGTAIPDQRHAPLGAPPVWMAGYDRGRSRGKNPRT
jgi:nitroimidazol reductase NimA-like FMN-containing flavoprotein (pyridoxamine 5'-phosphate oxidase superfamily)